LAELIQVQTTDIKKVRENFFSEAYDSFHNCLYNVNVG